MSVSTLNRPQWRKLVKDGEDKPNRMDLRGVNAAGIQSRMVASSKGLLNAVTYLRDHPLQFMFSTATSMATFTLVKGMLFAAAPGLGAGLIAAMATSALLASGRSLHKAMKERRQKIDTLYKFNAVPGAEELAAAKAINISEIFMDGLSQSLFSGMLSGLTGSALGELNDREGGLFGGGLFGGAGTSGEYMLYGYSPASSEIPTEWEYRHKFLEDVGVQESGGNYEQPPTAKTEYHIGKYQFGESALVAAGFYIPDGTDAIDWKGEWTDKAKTMGVDSMKKFLETPEAQEVAMQDWMAYLWDKFVNTYNVDDYVGQKVAGVEITKSGILAAGHLGGEGAVKRFFESAGDVIAMDKANNISILDYMKKFAGYKVPFAVDNPDQLPFYQLPAVSANCQSTIPHSWPVDPEVTLTMGDEHGMRKHPIHKIWKHHAGIDIPAAKGTDVLASADGVVERTGYVKGYGNQIVIKHFDGTNTHFSTYGHLSSIEVSEGQQVKMGQDIGGVGSTGGSTGNHLHYELRYDSDGDGKYSGSKVDKDYDPKSCVTDENGKGRVLINLTRGRAPAM